MLPVATGIRIMYCMNDTLRDYQQEMKLRLFKEWELHRSVMVQMPTGTGKTHLLAAIVREFLRGSGSRVWIVAHRRELVDQIEETVSRHGMSKEDGRVRVMSIQWLSRNRKSMDEEPDLIVIDEAHHALAETYRILWENYPEARKLGMTATPCRLNGKGFTDLFDSLITSWTVAEFIGKGWLSSFDYVSIRANSREQRLIDSLKKRGADGDYQVKEMNEVLNRETSIGRLYESVERYACGKKGIVYAVSIAHARRIAACYSAHGLEAVAIDSRTPASERRELVEDFRRGKVKVLVNVDIFSEGFDCPDVEFVQLARPTLSLAKYLQQVGRGLRRSADKASCMLIDNVGLYRIFGLPARNHDWAAMFEGRMIGNALSRARAETGRLSVSGPLPEEERQREDELEVVITHDRLMDFLTNREDSATEKGGHPENNVPVSFPGHLPENIYKPVLPLLLLFIDQCFIRCDHMNLLFIRKIGSCFYILSHRAAVQAVCDHSLGSFSCNKIHIFFCLFFMFASFYDTYHIRSRNNSLFHVNQLYRRAL